MPVIVGDATLYHADCRDVLRSLPDNSIDAVVTDPPYALVSIQKRFGKPGSKPANLLEGFRFIGCEREDEYMPIAEARIAASLRPIADNDNQPVAANAAVPANSNQPDLFGSAA